MRNRLAITATAISIFIFLSYVLLPGSGPPPLSYNSNSASTPSTATHGSASALSPAAADGAGGVGFVKVKPELLKGGVIMPKLGNETIKAELGRASWKLLHTMLARFPVKPTSEERNALHDYIFLFSRLYPCGECAEHFQALLKQFPPQTSSRDVASQWGCFVHNQVNERLKKEIFDCAKVSEHYKCGCADGGDGEKDKEKGEDGGELKAKEKEKAKLEKDSDEQGEEEDVKEAEEDAKKEVVNTPSWKSTKTLDENVEESRKHGAKIEVEKTGPINGG